MASISTSSTGNRTIQFVTEKKRRKSIRLGKVPMKTAEEVYRRVEFLHVAKVSGTAVDGDTAKWVASIGGDLYAKLAAVGLVGARIGGNSRLKAFIDDYITGRTDASRRTILNLKMFGNRLIAFFGAEKDMATVKRSDADDWVIFLKSKYAAATVGRTIKGARQFFRAACRAEVITSNPFDDIKAGSHTDKDRQAFITQEDTRRVLDACPDAEWRLIVALSRYGGLRCPSEHQALTWPDIDWEKGKFRVDSPKTGERWVPLFPELRPYLEDVFELAEPGAVHIISGERNPDQNLRTQLVRIIRRAGLTPWEKPFHNLRASRETELAAAFPLHVVCAWIGNSTLIAQKHYLQVTEDDFQRAAESGARALQNAVQSASVSVGTTSQSLTEDIGSASVSEDRRKTTNTDEMERYARRDSNPQPTVPKTVALSS